MIVELYVTKKNIKINLCDILIFSLSVWFVIRSSSFVDIVQVLSLSLLYFIIRYTGRKLKSLNFYKEINLIVIFIIIVALIQTIIGIFQLYGVFHSLNYNFKITGTTPNPAVFSFYLAALFPVILTWYIHSATFLSIKYVRFFRTVAFLTLLLIIVILVSTKIRTAWIGLICGGGVVFSFYYPNILNTVLHLDRLKKMIITGFIFIILLFGGYYLYQLKAHSAFGRLLIWEISSSMLKENPVSGIGLNRFKADYNRYQAEYFIANSGQEMKERVTDVVDVAYNEYFQIAIETGFVGLLLFVGCILFLIAGSIKKLNRMKDKKRVSFFLLLSCFSGFIAILAMSLFSYPLHCIPVISLFIIFLGVMNNEIIFSNDNKKNKVKFIDYHSVSIRNNVFRIICTITLLFICSLLVCNLTKVNSYIKWKNAVVEYENKQFKNSLNIYKSIYFEMKDNGLFLLYYGTCLIMDGECGLGQQVLNEADKKISDPIIYLKKGDCYKKEKNYQEAEKAYKYADAMIPVRLYPKYLLALLYEEQGKYNEAIEYAQRVINTKEKISNTATKEMKNEMLLLIKKYKL
jgi:O-antigen ligase